MEFITIDLINLYKHCKLFLVLWVANKTHIAKWHLSYKEILQMEQKYIKGEVYVIFLVWLRS